MKEFLSTGRIKKVEKLTENEEFPILEMFKEIHGVGPETAKLLFAKGIKTIEALRENQDLLSAVQKVTNNPFNSILLFQILTIFENFCFKRSRSGCGTTRISRKRSLEPKSIKFPWFYKPKRLNFQLSRTASSWKSAAPTEEGPLTLTTLTCCLLLTLMTTGFWSDLSKKCKKLVFL